jgi:hypothetical protein
MDRTLTAGTIYFFVLFALGFALGTMRVMFLVPVVGTFSATVAEIPIMLISAFFLCRWTLKHWWVPPEINVRVVMVVWFFALLAIFETALGALLFRQTLTEQWMALKTPAGMLGLSAQSAAAVFPLFVRRDKPRLSK